MLWTGTHFFKEIQYGQSICINFISNFCKGLGSYFVFVLYFPCLLPISQFCLQTPHFPREGLPFHGEFGEFSRNGNMKTEGGLGASPPDAGTAGLSLGGCSRPALGLWEGSEVKSHLEEEDQGLARRTQERSSKLWVCSL